MSKERENDAQINNQGDQGGNKPPSNKQLPTIEEHAKTMNIDAPVFAAVMQSKNWASGKRVLEADFKKAVETFLKSPMKGGE